MEKCYNKFEIESSRYKRKPLVRRIAVLTSNTGTGSNLQALLDAQTDGYNGQIVCVISAKPNVYGLVRAHEADVPTEVVDFEDYRRAGRPRAWYEEDLARKLQGYSPDLIVLAGWTMQLSKHFLRYFPWRVLNIHPGLLPDQPGERVKLPGGQLGDPCTGLSGENAIKAVLASGSKYAGSTVHVVTEREDWGPVVKRGLVKVKPDDTVTSLYDRVKQTEHKIIVQSLKELCLEAVPSES